MATPILFKPKPALTGRVRRGLATPALMRQATTKGNKAVKMPTTIHLVMRSGSGGDGGPVVYDAFTTEDAALLAITAYHKIEGAAREEAGYLYVEHIELHETAASALGIA